MKNTVLKKNIKNLTLKIRKGFTVMMVPNSGDSVRSFRLPLSLLFIVLIIIGFNIYTFLGYLAQGWRIGQYKVVLKRQEFQITRLLKDRQQLEPTIKKSYQMAMELNRLRQERLKLLELWKETQNKNSRSLYPLSRSYSVSHPAYQPAERVVESPVEPDLEDVARYLSQMQLWLDIESNEQRKLIRDLQEFQQQYNYLPSLNPVSIRRITSWFGRRIHPKMGYNKLHSGVDLRAKIGTRVLATAAGRVSFAGYKRGYGYTVIIEHGHGYQTLYAHNSKILVRPGVRVSRGKPICLSGNTGTSTGPHLHYEVKVNGKPVNPVWFLKN